MTITCRICSPYVPGLTGMKARGLRTAADDAAVRERVDNTRVTVLRGPTMGPRRTRAAFEILKLWENGRTLRCRFLDGRPEVMAKVEAIAKEWEQHANLRFEFVARGAAEIRISFAEKGFSWSTMGTDALTVPPREATMNYGWLEPRTPLREYQRVVRHEFGHAIGLIHEHQNPAAQGRIPWDKPKVYAYYAQQGWSKEDTDLNIFQVYEENSTNHSEWDPQSIMQYAIPEELTTGRFSVGWNTEFSPTDIAWTRRQYPRSAATVVALTPGPRRTAATLAAGGEVDSYSFEVKTAATYQMDTDGDCDTVLALHGPGDPGAVLAFDDDHGKGRNARIVRKLVPGRYWLTVRHKKPGGTGAYSIGVRKGS